jgi:tetratricopeptide (TPR) repeat protein
VFTLLALPVVYASVRDVVLASPKLALVLGPALLPSDYSAVVKRLAQVALSQQTKLPEAALATMKSAALAAPLGNDQFIVAAKDAEQRGDLRRAVALMEEAKRRRPNHVATRAQLLIYYGRTRRYSAVIQEVDFLIRRSETAKERVLAELVGMISVPAARDATALMLAKNPPWRADFFAKASGQNVAPAVAADLLRRVQRYNPRGDYLLEQKLYIQSLVSAGRYAEARRIWLASKGRSAPADALLFDGSFRARQADTPFGWSFHESELGRASPTADDGSNHRLEVEYFGGRNAVLASQLLALTPGTYTLKFNAQAAEAISSGDIAWRIGCMPQGAQILRLPLNGMRQGSSAMSARFTVPRGCNGQSLELVAEPGEYASPISFYISSMSIAPQ